MHRDRLDAIERAADIIDDIPTYYHVGCQHCSFSVDRRTEAEAELVGVAHESVTDGHTTVYEPVVLNEGGHPGLGFEGDP